MVRYRELPGERAGELTLALRGVAQFTQVSDLERELRRLLGGCQVLTLDLSGVDQLDASFSALLCLLHRQGELAGKELRLSGLPRRGGEALRYLRERGCHRQPNEGCRLWGAPEGPKAE
ncbi:hypothetical protein GMST_30970 [Geomonas silvestris]|uniref:STAS domain-containing protein n=1 Tax=Geomonas silvestris TaxID=2740184 RepID=A0A6V8MLC4_9BACT|nr:STAS domain-containing protein [Geomonas silvestris]GFO60772.1 hypothetical protein GMST_30970 [Geomonas silvestris]